MILDLKDDAALKAIISDAILAKLDAGTREAIIKEAIVHLTTPESGGYSRESPLQRAFRDAVATIARAEAVKMLEADTAIKGQIHDLIAAAVTAALNDREKLVGKIADTIARGLTGERY